jgi:peptidoglycan/xylan/chitin deacetylase (PgdA/CDA1 family)/GT2 family glycosyltransferase
VKCSIVIPTWQRSAPLEETLASLAVQTCSDFEVIVAVDGPDETTRLLSERLQPPFPIRWVFHERNLGQASARNSGAQQARGELLLFLDDDTSAGHELVERHVVRHDSEPNWPFAVCGKIVEDRRAAHSCWTSRFLQQSWEQTLDSTDSALSLAGDQSIGSEVERALHFGLNCSLRRDLFLAQRGFNPMLRYTDEDMEFGHRLYLSGVQFRMEPGAVVFHHNTKDMTEYFQRCWFLGGTAYVVRVFELGQRNPQTEGLAAMQRGWLPGRLYAKTVWHTTSVSRKIAAGLERATNYTGSRLFFGAWARLCQASEHWSGVKSKGCTLEILKKAAGTPARALMFHSISTPQSREESAYFISPQRFHRVLRRLKATGYEASSLAEWLQGDVPAHRPLLTFDDGYEDLYSELLPVARKLNFKPLVFLVADRIAGTNLWDHASGLSSRRLLTLEQIREMQQSGFDFGSHTLTHPWLPDLSDTDLRREVRESKHRLEDMLGTEITSFAYPFGGVDQRVRAAVAEAGYRLAFTINPGLNWWNDPLCLNRAEFNDLDGRLQLLWKLRTGYSGRQWTSLQLRTLESKLPGRILRNAVRSVRALGHRIANGALTSS